MAHLKVFENKNEYETFKNSDEFIAPNVSYVPEGLAVNYTAESMFPLHLSFTKIWNEKGPHFTTYNWKSKLYTTRLYNLLNASFIQSSTENILILPDNWLDEHPIFIDGHKVTSINKEDSRIFIYVEDDYPFNQSSENIMFAENFIYIDEKTSIIAYASTIG